MLNSIKYATVQFVWKIIDKLAEKQAKGAVLPPGSKLIADIPYKNTGLMAHLLDVYYPQDTRDPLPVIIYIHGGGFLAGDKLHTRQYCMTLSQYGYCVVNLNYRLAPEHKNPAAIEDVFSAMAWVRDNCHHYHGDSNRLILAGDSAGAYLAGLAAAICTNSKLAGQHGLDVPVAPENIRGVLLFSGLFDPVTAATRKFIGIKADIELYMGTNISESPSLDHYSVIKNITPGFPPALISSGQIDGLHPESEALSADLSKNNVWHRTLFFAKSEKKGFHCYQQHLSLDTAKQCMEHVRGFLADVLKEDEGM
ncbi:alpha/beta hydrolase [Dethiobacter alkaliphilus]|uniref:alpha/beta hydrolase n=1 Tax=Dethiobacter alkaliphilus TaxID=427926 RepID=UPI0022271D25|nr:alpha/beta hydrolase [Dethiobacter alkaliphilus]MCW3490648.1 alpha/beta hydrolase [Dethiobacter alkaliphilus]